MVEPNDVNDAEGPETVAVSVASAAPALPTSVTESVSPAHAAGIPLTVTCVTFPALSTSRAAVSAGVPHAVTVALPAERLVDPRARDAAAANAAKVALSASRSPSVLERAFMSLLLTGLTGQASAARGLTRCPPERAGELLAVDCDADAGDGRSGDVAARRQGERAAACRHGAVDRPEVRAARVARERDRDGLAGARGVEARDRDARDAVRLVRRVVGDGVGAGRGARRLTRGDGRVAGAQGVGADAQRGGEAVHGSEDREGQDGGENRLALHQVGQQRLHR